MALSFLGGTLVCLSNPRVSQGKPAPVLSLLTKSEGIQGEILADEKKKKKKKS